MAMMPRTAGTATWAQLEVGHRFTPRRYHIDEAMVREYCAALEIDAERYIRAGVVPPMLNATDYGVFAREAIRPFLGMHATQNTDLLRPVRIDEEIEVNVFYRDTFEKRGKTYIVLEVVVSDPAGEPLVRNVMQTTIDGYIDD